MTTDGPELLPPEELVRILKSSEARDILTLDLRVFTQYAQSRVRGSLNLCIPSTLLKRPSYNVKKLAATFSDRKDDKAKFESWRDVKTIVVYDLASGTLAQAASCVQVIQKFLNEKWQGATYVLEGGFNTFAIQCPQELDKTPMGGNDQSSVNTLAIDPSAAPSLVGGCPMPADNSEKPFYNTIRQNMDLICGVGQFPLRRPAALTSAQIENMPAWLRNASDPKDEGKAVADRFLAIEKEEQQRMQKALSSEAWQAKHDGSPNNHRIAGIEKGGKNRYKDILPFEHSRVILKEKNSGDCDYVNASHVKPKNTHMHYIACQAPIPATLRDFWRVVWEQGARVIVMLTAESEDGHLKAHPYWNSGTYGNFEVSLLKEQEQTLAYGPDSRPSRVFSTPVDKASIKSRQPHLNRRPTSNASAPFSKSASYRPPNPPPEKDAPHVTVRRLELTNTSDPSRPSRPISQVQLASWPDTGATARPKDILALVDLCDLLDTPHPSPGKPAAAQRPLIVHCSAGCGRTGTFCTVANVKTMLAKQFGHRQAPDHTQGDHQAASNTTGSMDVDGEKWIKNEAVDLVAMTVSELRRDRMSMVQTLRQFVLCYEAVMELFVHDDWGPLKEEPKDAQGATGRHGEKMDVGMEAEKPAKLSIVAPTLKRPGMVKRALSGI